MKFVYLVIHDEPNHEIHVPILSLKFQSYLGKKRMKNLYEFHKKTNEDELIAYNECFDGCQIQSNWEHYDKNGYSRK